jgi:hypothetical protein
MSKTIREIELSYLEAVKKFEDGNAGSGYPLRVLRGDILEWEREARIDQTQKLAAGVHAITKSEQLTEVEAYIAGELCALETEDNGQSDCR